MQFDLGPVSLFVHSADPVRSQPGVARLADQLVAQLGDNPAQAVILRGDVQAGKTTLAASLLRALYARLGGLQSDSFAALSAALGLLRALTADARGTSRVASLYSVQVAEGRVVRAKISCCHTDMVGV